VRPEHLDLDDEEGIEVEVLVVEPTGPETLLYVRLGNAHWNVVTGERLAVRPSDRLRLVPNIQSVHLFDRQTGERLDS
jgi:multiple sugar transport system ATP-binding protein